jgi:fructokinase
MSKKILGIGNAIVDVFVKVDDDFLSKNKLTKGSMKLIEKTEFESLKSKIKILAAIITLSFPKLSIKPGVIK